MHHVYDTKLQVTGADARSIGCYAGLQYGDIKAVASKNKGGECIRVCAVIHPPTTPPMLVVSEFGNTVFGNAVLTLQIVGAEDMATATDVAHGFAYALEMCYLKDHGLQGVSVTPDACEETGRSGRSDLMMVGPYLCMIPAATAEAEAEAEAKDHRPDDCGATVGGDVSYSIDTITLVGRYSIAGIYGPKLLKTFPVHENFGSVVGLHYDRGERVVIGHTGLTRPGRTFPECFQVMYLTDAGQRISVKVYFKGALQLTGAHSLSDGNDAARAVADSLEAFYAGTDVRVRALPCRIAMVNVSLRVPPVNSMTIATELRAQNVVVETGSPNMKVSYMWNRQPQKRGCPGVCSCTKYCSYGKGDGHGDRKCNCTTITILSSGLVRLVGSRYLEQVDEAASFITSVAKDHVHARFKPVAKPLDVASDVASVNITTTMARLVL